mmetsp:Transcript_24296/g.52275  ORF Transcript_24296/g.52275 Transcript_24296/m.52275 type:complete len:80 (-) Transcript_24296:147-386(-)
MSANLAVYTSLSLLGLVALAGAGVGVGSGTFGLPLPASLEEKEKEITDDALESDASRSQFQEEEECAHPIPSSLRRHVS